VILDMEAVARVRQWQDQPELQPQTGEFLFPVQLDGRRVHMTWDPARVDAAGAVITGAGVVGGAAIAVDAGIPYLAAASSPIARGVSNTWRISHLTVPRLAACMLMDDW